MSLIGGHTDPQPGPRSGRETSQEPNREPGREPNRGPDLEPVPVTGCDICAALAGQREEARAEGRMDTVRSCNRELLNHPRAEANVP